MRAGHVSFLDVAPPVLSLDLVSVLDVFEQLPLEIWVVSGGGVPLDMRRRLSQHLARQIGRVSDPRVVERNFRVVEYRCD